MSFEKDLEQFGLEKASGRYYGIYKGIVFNNIDPNQQGRVYVVVPELGRVEPLLQYAYPVSAYAGVGSGLFFPPEIGDHVWIMFEGGNPAFPVYLGGWWTNPLKSAAGTTIPVEARSVGGPPLVREIRTRGGHRVIFDDAPAGGITIQGPQGTIIRMRDSGSSIEIIASGEVSIKAGSASIEAVTADVKATTVSVKASDIGISGSTRFNNGAIAVAAIGDEVTVNGNVGTITATAVKRPFVSKV